MNEIVNLGNGQYVKVCMLKGQQGDNIASIVKTGTSGLVDTYTVILTNGDTATFDVTNGNGIVSIVKTATVGLVDTYTITFDNGDTATFNVTNGENGQDVSQSNLAPVEETSTASQSYSVGQHLVFNSIYYKVIQPISQGASLISNTNIQQETVSASIDNSIEAVQNDMAPVEKTSTASQSYSVGSHLVYNNAYCVVTQAIAQGGALSIGVNIEQVSISSEIETLQEKGLKLLFSNESTSDSISRKFYSVIDFLRVYCNGNAVPKNLANRLVLRIVTSNGLIYDLKLTYFNNTSGNPNLLTFGLTQPYYTSSEWFLESYAVYLNIQNYVNESLRTRISIASTYTRTQTSLENISDFNTNGKVYLFENIT